MKRAEEIPVIIPSLEPDERLIGIVGDLLDKGIKNIIIVDDGSGEKFKSFFAEVEARGCVVLRHAVNLGKGRALKTAFNYCLQNFSESDGCVTADSDGQHTAEDILRCAEALCENPDKLIMGCRDFVGEHVPVKNRTGNKITAFVFSALCGVSCSDTQTGLRAISSEYMKKLLSVSGERFEFETNMLIEAKNAGVELLEIPIKTIYQGEQYTTHFNPITDSLKIYKLFGKFIFASLAGTVVDLLFFTLFTKLLKLPLPASYILVSTVCARLISASENFVINKKVVFKSHAKTSSTAVKYAVLCAVIMLLSGCLVTLIHSWLGGSETLVKVAVDLVLFVVSFVAQREIVFKEKKRIK